MSSSSGIHKWKNNKLALVARVKTRAADIEGFIEAPDLRRVQLGKGKVYIYVKTDRGSVNTIYERKAYQADFVELLEITDKKLKRASTSGISS